MSVLEIEEGKTYWYGFEGVFRRVTALKILVSPGKSYEKEALHLVRSSLPVRADRESLDAQIASREFEGVPAFDRHELFPDKATAIKAWATELRRRADAVESM